MASSGQEILIDGIDRGIVFRPQGGDPHVGVIVLHERYGLVQHTLDIAARLATSGYLAVAPDLFSRWEGDAEALARGDIRATVSDDSCAATIDTWVEWLGGSAGLDPGRVVVMGVCQSGRYPIVSASRRDDLGALVVFYGAAKEDDWGTDANQPKAMRELITTVRTPGLFVFGEADHVISVEDVRRLRDCLEAARCSFRMMLVPEVPHGFLNDTMPGRYRPAAAEQSWAELRRFLDEVFAGGWPDDEVRWEFTSRIAADYDFSSNVRLE